MTLAPLPATRDAAIAQAATADWPGLLDRIADLERAWQDASADLDQTEARSLIGEPESAADDPWNVEQLYNHVARSLIQGADTLSLLAVSHPAAYDGRYALLAGDPPFDRVQALLGKGWIDFFAAAKTVAKQPERGAVIDTPRGPMSARQLVGLITWHVNAHIKQIRSLRAAGAKTG